MFDWHENEHGVPVAERVDMDGPKRGPNSGPVGVSLPPKTGPRTVLWRTIRVCVVGGWRTGVWVAGQARQWGIETVPPIVAMVVWVVAWRVASTNTIWGLWFASADINEGTNETGVVGGGLVWRPLTLFGWWVVPIGVLMVACWTAAAVLQDRQIWAQRFAMAGFICSVVVLAFVTERAGGPGWWWPARLAVTLCAPVGAVVWVLLSPIDSSARGFRRRVRAHRVRRLWQGRIERVVEVCGLGVPVRVVSAVENVLAARVVVRVMPGRVPTGQVAGVIGARGAEVWGAIRWADHSRGTAGAGDVSAVVDPGDASRVTVTVRRGDALAEAVTVETVDVTDRGVRVGRDVSGRTVRVSPADGHVGCFGATRSGKSATMRLIAAGAVQAGHRVVVIDCGKPDDWKCFDGALSRPVAETVDGARGVLSWVVSEMEAVRRGMGDVSDMAALPSGRQRWITVVVDELGDLLADKDVMDLVSTIGRRGMASGVRLVVGSQRPTADMVPPGLLAQIVVRWVGTLADPAARVVLGDVVVPVWPSSLPQREGRGVWVRLGFGAVVMRTDWLDPASVRRLCGSGGRVSKAGVSGNQGEVLVALGDGGTAKRVAGVVGRDVAQVRRELRALERKGVVRSNGGRPESWSPM